MPAWCVDVGGIRAEVLRAAADALLRGGVALIPTDTVYGLAAHPDFPDALRRIYEIKGRDFDKPVAFLAADASAPARLGARLSPPAAAFARRFWPGALTLVLDCGGTTEGFRVPDFALTRDLLALCGGLLRVTSANLSGHPAATRLEEVPAAVRDRCDAVVDAGPSPVGVASTVVRDAPSGWTVLREGAVTCAMLGAAAATSAGEGTPR